MKKALILDSQPYVTSDRLQGLGDYDVLCFDARHDPLEIEALIIHTKKINWSVLQIYKNVKAIYRTGVWVDMIDMELCRERAISVYNTPGANASSVADLAIWGVLGLCRKVGHIDADVADGQYRNRYDYVGHDIASQRICLVWFGAIGKLIRQRLQAFGVEECLIVDPHMSVDMCAQYPGIKKIETLSDVITEIDIVSIQIPLLPTTKDYINKTHFDRARSNLKVINMGRGGLVNESDLLDFLRSHPEAGAYLDVWVGEPDVSDVLLHLQKLPNVVWTPHVAGITQESIRRMHDFRSSVSLL